MSTTTAGGIASVTVDVGGQEIVFETGKLAKQADGASSSAWARPWFWRQRSEARRWPDADSSRLVIDVEEKMYAAGKIPGALQALRPCDRAGDAHRADDGSPGHSGRRASATRCRSSGSPLADLITPHDILASTVRLRA
jgi:hypothetical protein